MELEKVERKYPALTLQQAQNVLSRAARNVGRIYSVGLAVGQQSNGLMFVDDLGNAVVDDFAPDGPMVIPCCSEEELKSGEFLKFFAARSLYAALTLKIGEILESEGDVTASHPMDMSLSVTGWAIDPELLEDISYELVHSDMTGDCFRIKMAFKNGTDALLEIEMKDGSGIDTYERLTEAIRTRRLPPLVESDDAQADV